MARSKENKIADGYKANETKIARFGPSEPKRAADQARWTKENPGRPKTENPYLREKIYSPKQLEQAENHKVWGKANPRGSDAENPYTWRQAA